MKIVYDKDMFGEGDEGYAIPLPRQHIEIEGDRLMMSTDLYIDLAAAIIAAEADMIAHRLKESGENIADMDDLDLGELIGELFGASPKPAETKPAIKLAETN